MVSRSNVDVSRDTIESQELNHVVFEYVKSKNIIDGDMGTEDIKAAIEENLTQANANKILELLGIDAKTRTHGLLLAVTLELQQGQDMLEKRINDDMEMSATAKKKLEETAKVF